MSNNRLHDKALEDIANHPDKIGLSGVVESRIEVPIINQNGKYLAEIDVLFELMGNIYVATEYKCNDSCKQRLRCEEQLIIGKQGLKEHLGINCSRMLYINNRFPYEVNELVVMNDHYEWVRIQ